MIKRRLKMITLGALSAGALVLIWAVIRPSPLVSLTILDITVRQYSVGEAGQAGSSEYVVATIELTNASRRPVTYLSRYDGRWADYRIQHRTRMGWEEKFEGMCGTGLEQHTLAPSQVIHFDASIERDKPCKVALHYSDGGTPSRLRQRLPRWLAQRLPWGSGWKTVTSEVIDLRGRKDLPVRRVERSPGPSIDWQDLPTVQAAAQNGVAEAQFRLAGRYVAANGVEGSLTEALRWYEAAGTNGHAEAAYNLGTIYDYGLGTSADPSRAIEWYERASQRGHNGAKERLQAVAGK